MKLRNIHGTPSGANDYGSLHDSVLVEVLKHGNEKLVLSFQMTDGRMARLTVGSECDAMLWASGILVPAIISHASLHSSYQDLTTYITSWKDSISESLLASHGMYFPNGGWA